MFGSRPSFGTGTSSFSNFGTNTSTAFGSSAFGRPAFGTPTTSSSPFGSSTSTGTTSLFGQSQNAGGGGLFGPTHQSGFGTTSTGFGTSGGGIFGSSGTQPSSSGGLFGSSTSSGFNSTQTQPRPFSFGTPTTSSSSGIFGSTTGGSLFGSTVGQPRGTVIKYNPVTGTDTMTRSGVSTNIQTKIEVITAMKEYEAKSMEELRVEDYLSSRKGTGQGQGQGTTGFGFGVGQSTFGLPQQNKGWLSDSSQGGGLFGQKPTENKSLFGSGPSGYGATGSAGGLFGSTTTPFGQTGTASTGFAFGQSNQSKPGGFSFNNQTTSSSLFGTPSTSQTASTFGSTSGGSFSFGQNQPNSNPFGTQSKPIFGSPNAGPLLFGNKPAGSSFTGFGAQTSASPFGTTNTNTGTGLFGSQNKPSFSLGSGFGSSTPAFGSGSGGGLFGSSTTQNKPVGLTFGTSGGFGSNPSSGFSFNQSNVGSGGLFGNTGGGLFGNSNTSLNPGSTFGTSLGTGFGLGTLQPNIINNNSIINNDNITNLIKALAHNPFGTSPLLMNSSAQTGKADELLNAPTTIASTTNTDGSKLSTWKRPMYVLPTGSGNVPKPKQNRMNRIINGHSDLDSKYMLFAGLEDASYNSSEDPFKPKLFPNIKKLNLKVFRNTKDICGGETTSNSSLVNGNSDSNVPTPLTTPINSPDTLDAQNANSLSKDNSPTSDIIKGRNNMKKFNLVNKNHNNDTLADLNMVLKPPTTEIRLPFPSTSGIAQLLEHELDNSFIDSQKENSISLDEPSLVDVGDSIVLSPLSPHPAGIKLNRAGYYTIPSLEDLAEMTSDGSCLVENFTVGRYGYGNVCFQGITNVMNLDLDSVVFIVRKEIEVYPEGIDKPKIGEGLNKAAYVTLDCVWPVDKSNHEVIKSQERLEAIGWCEHLERQCIKMGATFVEYRPETGSWVFKVKHFSKYGLEEEANEDSIAAAGGTSGAVVKVTGNLVDTKSKENIPPSGVSPSAIIPTSVPAPSVVNKVSLPVSTYSGPAPVFNSRGAQYSGPPTFGLSSPSVTGFLSEGMQDNLVPSVQVKAPVYLDGSTNEIFEKEIINHGRNEIEESDFISPLSPSVERLTVSSKVHPIAIQSLKSQLSFGDLDDESQVQKGEKRDAQKMDLNIFRKSEELSLYTLKVNSKKLLMQSELPIELFEEPPSPVNEVLATEEVEQEETMNVEPHLKDPKTEYLLLSSSHDMDLDMEHSLTQHLSEKIPLTSSLVSKSKGCICDAAATMSRSFRVGWGPGWTLVHAGRPLDLSSELRNLSMSRPITNTQERRTYLFSDPCKSRHFLEVPTNETKKYSVVIEHLHLNKDENDVMDRRLDYLVEACLENVLEHSSATCEDLSDGTEYSCPYFTPIRGINLLQHLAITATQVEDSEERDRTFSSIFDLCVALWGELTFYSPDSDGDSEYIKAQARKEALSQWLEEVSEAAVVQETERALADEHPDAYLDAIFSFLTTRQISEACTLAQEKGDYHLALLLSQCCLGDEIPRQIMNQQLSHWNWTCIDEFISIPRLVLYLLLGGKATHEISSLAKINTCVGLDWRRALAIHMWYICPTTATVAEVLSEYEKAAGLSDEKVDVYCEVPFPPYLATIPLPENSKVNFDVCFQLLKLFVDPSVSLESLLQNSSVTADPMDVACSWFLWCILQSLGYTHLSCSKVEMIHTNMAALLESIGQWHWASFVIMCMPDEQKRKNDLSDLLNRHLLIEGEAKKQDPFYREKEHFLMKELKLPEQWLYKAKAIRARILNKVEEEAWYLLKAGDYNRAHSLVEEFIAPNAIVNEDHQHLLYYLNKLSEKNVQIRVTDWDRGGGIYLNYLQVIDQVEEMKESRQPTGAKVEKLRPKLLALCSRLNNLSCPTAIHRLCISEMSRVVVSVLRAILGEEPDGIRVLAQQVSALPLAHECAIEELNQITRQYLTRVSSSL